MSIEGIHAGIIKLQYPEWTVIIKSNSNFLLYIAQIHTQLSFENTQPVVRQKQRHIDKSSYTAVSLFIKLYQFVLINNNTLPPGSQVYQNPRVNHNRLVTNYIKLRTLGPCTRVVRRLFNKNSSNTVYKPSIDDSNLSTNRLNTLGYGRVQKTFRGYSYTQKLQLIMGTQCCISIDQSPEKYAMVGVASGISEHARMQISGASIGQKRCFKKDFASWWYDILLYDIDGTIIGKCSFMWISDTTYNLSELERKCGYSASYIEEDVDFQVKQSQLLHHIQKQEWFSGDINSEAEWVMLRITNDLDSTLRILNVNLNYGRYYKCQDKSQDRQWDSIDVPLNKHEQICAIGTATWVTGTTGTIGFSIDKGQTMLGTLYFDCPYWASNTVIATELNKSYKIIVGLYPSHGPLGLVEVHIKKAEEYEVLTGGLQSKCGGTCKQAGQCPGDCPLCIGNPKQCQKKRIDENAKCTQVGLTCSGKCSDSNCFCLSGKCVDRTCPYLGSSCGNRDCEQHPMCKCLKKDDQCHNKYPEDVHSDKEDL